MSGIIGFLFCVSLATNIIVAIFIRSLYLDLMQDPVGAMGRLYGKLLHDRTLVFGDKTKWPDNATIEPVFTTCCHCKVAKWPCPGCASDHCPKCEKTHK